jgi:hypothetical protein
MFHVKRFGTIDRSDKHMFARRGDGLLDGNFCPVPRREVAAWRQQPLTAIVNVQRGITADPQLDISREFCKHSTPNAEMPAGKEFERLRVLDLIATSPEKTLLFRTVPPRR